jgi:DnaK suppressor protein
MSVNKEEIKAKILSEIERTKKAIEDYKEMTKPIAPDNAIGRVSRMDAINNKSVAEAGLRKAEAKLENLQEMLPKVEKDEFGTCAKCKREIPVGRILLMPESRFCVNCAG